MGDAQKEVDNAAVEPELATLAELKKSFPQADDTFLVGCLEKQVTLDQARQWWTEVVEVKAQKAGAESEQLRAELGESKDKIAELEAAAKQRTDESTAADERDLTVGGVTGGQPAANSRAGVIVEARKAYAAESRGNAKVICSELAWVNTALMDRKQRRLNEQEVEEQGIATELAD